MTTSLFKTRGLRRTSLQRTALQRASLLSVPLLATLLISGCAVDKAGCDPAAVRSAGFLTKLSCDVSGSYDARAQDQQQDLAAAKADNEALQAVLTGLVAENRELEEGLIVKRAERDKLVRSINAYLKQVEQGNNQTADLKAQVAQTRQELDRLQNLPTTANKAQQQQRLNAVQQEIDTLRAMVP